METDQQQPTALPVDNLEDLTSEQVLELFAQAAGNVENVLQLADLRDLVGKYPEYEQSMLTWQRFYTSVHERKNFQPGTGIGAFDLRLEPSAGVLTIGLRLNFRFIDGNLMEFPFASPSDLEWTQAAKIAWKTQFVTQAQVKWSGKHRLWCQRDWWEAFRVRARISINESPENPHFIIRVIKLPPNQSGNPLRTHSFVQSPRLNADGSLAPGILSTHSNSMSPDMENDYGYRRVEAMHLFGHLLGLDREWGRGPGDSPRHSLLAQRLGVGNAPAGFDKRLMSAGSVMDEMYAVPFLEALGKLTSKGPWGLRRKRSRPVPWDKFHRPDDYTPDSPEEDRP